MGEWLASFETIVSSRKPDAGTRANYTGALLRADKAHFVIDREGRRARRDAAPAGEDARPNVLVGSAPPRRHRHAAFWLFDVVAVARHAIDATHHAGEERAHGTASIRRSRRRAPLQQPSPPEQAAPRRALLEAIVAHAVNGPALCVCAARAGGRTCRCWTGPCAVLVGPEAVWRMMTSPPSPPKPGPSR